MAEWLIEEGIGETRSLLIGGGEVLAARHIMEGAPRAGEVHQAQLTERLKGTARGLSVTESGLEVLIDKLPQSISEGASVTLRLTRAPIAERGRLKRAQGRIVDTATTAQAEGGSDKTRPVAAFEAGLWEEVWHAASSGSIDFAGGAIVCSATPAMTLIDVDGHDSPCDLALAAIPAIKRALFWFEIGGNIGIDFPTIEAKADRRAVDQALDEALGGWPHERTAMNGFGFVQLIARLEGPSLLHRFATSRTGMCARYALRIGERAQGAGPVLLLRVHPALKAKLKPQWIEELTRRTGKQVRIETDPGLALEAPQAQIVEV
ncbi:MAG: ribonuclease [Pseudomonadota bacterium]